MKIGNTQNNEALVNLNKAKEEQKFALKNIASQRPIYSTDGASLALANELLAQINSMSQGVRNANDALGVMQIADSALSTISDSAIRINALSVSLGNPALNSSQRAMVEKEAATLTQAMNDSINQATFNGKNVFSGQMSFVTGNGVESINLQAPKISSLSVNSQQSILDFMNEVNTKRADIGAAMNGVQSGINASMNTLVNLKTAEGNLLSDDLAENYNKLNNAKLKENAILYANAFNTRNLQNRLDSLLG